jgi:hypothetical protein
MNGFPEWGSDCSEGPELDADVARCVTGAICRRSRFEYTVLHLLREAGCAEGDAPLR